MMRRTRLRAGIVVAGALAVAACGSGRSINEAGFDPIAPAPPAAADQSAGGDTNADGTYTSTDGATTTEATGDSPTSTVETTPAPTTTAVPVEELEPCPVDALDNADGPVEVTMWFGLSGDLPDVLNALAAEYNASQDRVVLNLENQTDYEAVVDKFTQFGVNERPELLISPEFTTQAFAQSGQFVPLESCINTAGYDTSTFLTGALSAYSFSGNQWGLPFNASNPVLYYNRVLFEAAGLDPDDPPLTFDELRETSQVLVDSGVAANGFVVDNARDSGTGGAAFEQWFARSGAFFADNGNGRLAPATGVNLNDPAGVEIMTFLADMLASALSVSVGDNAGGQAVLLKLADGENPAVMAVETSAALGTVKAALDAGLIPGIGSDDIGVAPMPGPSDMAAAQIGGGSFWIPAGKSDEQIAAAWDVVQFMVSAQSQSSWADGTGYVPVRTDALDLEPLATTYVDDPRFRVAYDQLLTAGDEPVASRPILGPQREIRQVVADAIARVYADPAGADIIAILNEADAEADAIITNYNRLN